MDPEYNTTFSKILDLTEEMVSTTMMVTGVRLLGTAVVVLSIFFLVVLMFRHGIHINCISMVCNLVFKVVSEFLVESRLIFVL